MVDKCLSCGRDMSFSNKALFGKDKDKYCRFCLREQANANLNEEISQIDEKANKGKYPSIIKDALIERSVAFKGGYGGIDKIRQGSLGVTNEKLVFKIGISGNFEIPFNQIKKIEIVDDNYTPGVMRTLFSANTAAQSLGKHKTVLKIVIDTGNREKELMFQFGGSSITWDGAVKECDAFYAKFNSLLD